MKQTVNNRSKPQSWPIKALATSIIVALTVTIAQGATTNRKPIGDLEIYKPAKPGSATIFMMLDTSASMGDPSLGNDYGSSYNSNNCTVTSLNSEKIRLVIYKRKLDATQADGLLRDNNGNTVKDLNAIDSEVTFIPEGCKVNEVVKYSRLVRLQLALIELLADDVYTVNNTLKDTGSLPDNYEVGLGNYSYNGNSRSGVVSVPTKLLTAKHRAKLIVETKNLVARGGTPTAQALAESGAYMMGTTTFAGLQIVGERKFDSGYFWRKCNDNQTKLTFDADSNTFVSACKSNGWSNWSSNSSILPSFDAFVETNNNGRVYYKNDSKDSGYLDSVEAVRKTKEATVSGQENSYISPLSSKECSGSGIYLLTDGQPDNSSTSRAKKVMNISLQQSPSLSVNSCSALTGGSSDGAWGCMAEYAALLRNANNNPLKIPIKTATVGFGRSFKGITGTRSIIVNGETKTVTDCDSGTNVNENAKNLCKLGERKGDNETKTFGNGGFYYTEESQDIANSIVDFASNLVQVIDTAPSGTITIPEDPFRASNQLPYAYLPMIDPEITSAASIWQGNLKKYDLNNGTLYGQDNNLLFKDVIGNLSENTQDLWQASTFEKDNKAANNDVLAGGVYAQLRAPSSGLASVRSVYVEDATSATDKKPVLRKLGVGTDGKPTGFADLKDPIYTQLNQRRLLSFLGFDTVLTADGQPTSETAVKDLVLTRPTKEIKLLGGVVHSKPTAISYSATLDARGRITDTRDDAVLFGSMDGALHLVKADDGIEEVAIIPKSMLQTQPKALVEGSFKDEVGEPYFGVDAPWLVTTDYKYDLSNDSDTAGKVKVDSSTTGKGMFAYGGLRMGGQALYGMDITTKSTPKIIFTITPDGLNYTASNDFARLGQIWSKPTAAKIRVNKEDEPIDVLIFGGGYDMVGGSDNKGYENEEYVPTTTNPARGNAIYMINAQTGELIGSASSGAESAKNINTATMINSIVGEITILDRDNDGLVDHVYAADLGGQVFRADIENARPAKFGFAAIDKFAIKRVVRVLNSAPSDGKLAYRFYERPVVSFYRNQGGSNNGKLFALINVISGNRSAPLSTLRDSNTYANRLYGIIDNDITSSNLFKDDFEPSVINLTETNLVNLASTLGNAPTAAIKQTTKTSMVNGTLKGWYYPLTRFDGYNNVRYNKGMGNSAVINNVLYTTVYNPEKQFGTVNSCAAQTVGGSERQLYCLPYGICADANSVNGTGGYVPAGKGIQELALGAFDKQNTDIKVLIGTTTITDRVLAANRVNSGAGGIGTGFNEDGTKKSSNIKDLTDTELDGGDGSAIEFLFNERYTLQPRAWYQKRPSS